MDATSPLYFCVFETESDKQNNTFFNKFLKKKALESRAKYNKQRNICVSLVKKAKQNYYENLDLRDNNDNKTFWATVKLLFSNKIKSAENIYLDESGKIIRNKK